MTPLVERNAAGEFLVTMPYEAWAVLSAEAASWQLWAAARLIDRALKGLPPSLPPGSRVSWRRGTWA